MSEYLVEQLRARADCIRATSFVHISEKDAREFADLFDQAAEALSPQKDEAEQPMAMPKGGFTDEQIMASNYASILANPSKLGYRVSSDHLRWCYELIRKIPQGIGAGGIGAGTLRT